MSSTTLLPPAFWFRLALPCRYVGEIPRTKGLLELPVSCSLPELTRLDGREPWADIRMGWNEKGIGVSVEVTGKAGPIRRSAHDPDFGDGVQVWIDTRDTREVHRATRFSHRFLALLNAKKGAGELGVEISQRPIARALADAPRDHASAVRTRADRLKKGWRLELFFPAIALNGFDPETNRRLGVLIQVTDPDRGDQYLGVGREFPIGEDPSLWSTLELVRDDG